MYGGGGATFEMNTFNRENCLVVARFGMSAECTRFVAGQFFLNDSGLTVSMRSEATIQRFVEYKLMALNDEIYALGSGTAQKNLDVSAFRKLPISFPESLTEQLRIVTLLDDALKGISAARESTKNKIKMLEKLEKSLLNEASSGNG